MPMESDTKFTGPGEADIRSENSAIVKMVDVIAALIANKVVKSRSRIKQDKLFNYTVLFNFIVSLN
jgi:hypothetical protein